MPEGTSTLGVCPRKLGLKIPLVRDCRPVHTYCHRRCCETLPYMSQLQVWKYRRRVECTRRQCLLVPEVPGERVRATTRNVDLGTSTAFAQLHRLYYASRFGQMTHIFERRWSAQYDLTQTENM